MSISTNLFQEKKRGGEGKSGEGRTRK